MLKHNLTNFASLFTSKSGRTYLQFLLKNTDFWCLLTVINCDKTNIRNENSTDKPKQNVINVRNDRENELEFKSGTVNFFSKAGLTRQSFIETLYIDYHSLF
jgi:hypothetical protein